MVEIFYVQGVSFVSITFNTTTSMEWLTLNVLLSCAQFEREVRGSASGTSYREAQDASSILQPVEAGRCGGAGPGQAVDSQQAEAGDGRRVMSQLAADIFRV